MQVRTLIISFICAFVVSASLFASPARKGPVVMMQPDGSTFQAVLQGDEFVKIKTTAQGHAIVQDKDGWWCYAIFDTDGGRCSSGWRVGENTPVEILQQSSDIPYALLNDAAAIKKQKVAFVEQEEPLLTRIRSQVQTRTGESGQIVKHGIVILAQFRDVQFKYGKSSFENLLSQSGYSLNGATGCAKEYFEAQFGTNVKFEFKVSDIVTLSKKRSHYGGNDSNGEDSAPAEMVKEACEAANVDFSLYDDDNDDVVDNVFIIFAGADEAEGADEECIWSHSWYLQSGAGMTLYLNGKKIDRYACAAELTRVRQGGAVVEYLTGIGTFCHEYSHTLGLPDFYDTNYEQDGGWASGLWASTSLMDSGNQNNNGNTPPYFNAIEREILGIEEPVILKEEGNYTLTPIHGSNLYYRMDTDTEGEYYLFECRAETGWDKFIGGNGMLVYHIDKSNPYISRWTYQNTVNAYKSHQCADLVEADSRKDDFTDVSDYIDRIANIRSIFFPYSNVTSLTANSTPALVFWSGKRSEKNITGIKRSGNDITFTLLDAQETSGPPYPKELVAEAFSDAAIVRFESSYAYTGDATVKWSRAGKLETVLMVSPYSPGKYVLLLEGLEQAGKTYEVEVCFEKDGMESEVKTISFMTKRHPPVSWPFIYLKGASRNDDSSFVAGTRIPLYLYNATGAEAVQWYFDDQLIEHEGDWYFTINQSGTLKALVIWKDGSKDIIAKEIIVQ